ncbi:Helicase associated domain protein [Rhodococcus qingshengii]|uniref:Helicase associated domain protein n=1 Tax=Rhodococcus qingshengii TaxID=334542 RepID=A0AAW6LN06_RHOSG|nr:Helicase associated domain protein [Rhodococcus qingshengii]MDE8649037.1 Helicase associated domain protein [Rhodococcus qingshengii]
MSEPDTGSALTPPASLLAAAVSTAEWTAALAILRDYTTLQGTAELQTHTTWSGFDLGAWGRRVRGVHNKGLLSYAQIAELEALPGWTWKYNLKTLPWGTGIAALRDYAAHYGLAVVPRKTIWKGLELDEWVARVRKMYAQGELATDRADELGSLPGWLWFADDRNLLTTEAVAAYIRKSPVTVEQWRRDGTGPAHYTLGDTAYYDRTVVDRWRRAHPHLFTVTTPPQAISDTGTATPRRG